MKESQYFDRLMKPSIAYPFESKMKPHNFVYFDCWLLVAMEVEQVVK